MEFNRSDWKLICKDNQKDKSTGLFNGHSVWLHIPTGKYAIKDMSGDYPHETDDGVLWIGELQKHEQGVLSVTDVNGHEHVVFINGDLVRKLTEMDILNEDIKAVHRLRSKGYAVVVFTPQEVHDENVRALEDRLIEVGNQIIEQLQE